MYLILFSITIHENPECFIKLAENIFAFHENSAILVHIALQSPITPEQIQSLEKIPHVYVNPLRVYTQNYKILTPLLANFITSHSIDYEYICLLASNCFFYRKGSYQYMQNYDMGCYAFENRNYSGKWADCRKFSLFIGNHSGPNYTGQHEGVFLKKKLVKPLCDKLFQFCPLEQWNQPNDTTEESFLPTAINVLFKDKKRGFPICLLRDRMKHLFLDTDQSYDFHKTVEYLRFLASHPEEKIDYVLEEIAEDNHFFCFKRIPRNLDDPLTKIFTSSFFIQNIT
jgi:hypothetical protein